MKVPHDSWSPVFGSASTNRNVMALSPATWLRIVARTDHHAARKPVTRTWGGADPRAAEQVSPRRSVLVGGERPGVQRRTQAPREAGTSGPGRGPSPGPRAVVCAGRVTSTRRRPAPHAAQPGSCPGRRLSGSPCRRATRRSTAGPPVQPDGRARDAEEESRSASPRRRTAALCSGLVRGTRFARKGGLTLWPLPVPPGRGVLDRTAGAVDDGWSMRCAGRYSHRSLCPVAIAASGEPEDLRGVCAERLCAVPRGWHEYSGRDE